MKKPFKILAVALSAIVLLLGLGIAYLSFVFDPNQFKSQLIELVKNKKHRDLAIDGNIQLKFFPKLGVSLEKIKLSEFESTTQFAAVDKAQVSLALFPLLQKQIVVDKISLQGLQLRYQRDAAGQSNIDDLIKQESTNKEAESTSSATQQMRFDIEGIEIAQSNFAIDDQKSELKGRIHDLNLSTGKISDKNKTPIKFSAQFQFAQPKAEAKIDINTQLRFDIEQKLLDLQDLKTQIAGKLGSNPFDVEIGTAAMQLSPNKSASEQIQLAAKLGGTQELNTQIVLSKLQIQDKQLQIAELSAQAQSKQAGSSKQVNLKSSLSMGLDTQVVQLPQLALQIKLNDPKLAQTEILIPINGQFSANLKDKSLDTKLDAKFDETKLQTSVQVNNFSNPAISFKVDIDKINLDRYIKNAAEPAKADNSKEEDLNLSAFKSLNLDGLIRIGALQVKNLKINQVALPIKANQGKIAMNGITAQLYQGSVAGNMGFDVDGNHFQMQQNLSNVQINPILVDFMQKDIVEGRGNLNLNINTHGKRVSQFKDNLNGSVRTQLTDGAVKGINLAKSLRDFKAKILNKADQQQAANKNEKTDFSAFSVSMQFVDGIGNSDDLDMKSPFLRVGGKGQVNLRNSSLDYTARTTLVNTSAGQDGADLSQLKDLSIPVRISGPFDKLGYQILFSQIGSEALKSAFKAKAAPVLEEKKKELKEKVNEELKGKLKGLFGQ
ncbi:AsmA family protein [Undibacterium baiyunense]|uniref:AsmA family protein n=1 Tax=Undibacterium baiyunense TaxID=2828731 RepID=A0A941DHX2_9BURK|nr:AsmA family protein [Undibacterium baiyunense]MBR7747212.1 AsmA family protein [Undibacterium baiyunense]